MVFETIFFCFVEIAKFAHLSFREHVKPCYQLSSLPVIK
uniref:Uncharacterized protein n=1 Tax=Arundo donax TaxID=35708 RepID=A0A0A9BXV3_ARUDO